MISYRYGPQSEWQVLTPTVFPDNTSQSWKIKEFIGSDDSEIKWEFESEVEFIQILQLKDLIESNQNKVVTLYLPYFPYARQDKKVSNNSTFAKGTFLKLLTREFLTIITYDIHSDAYNTDYYYTNIINQRPDHFLKAIEDFKPDSILFPDKGAMKRYQTSFSDNIIFNMIPKMYGEKVRDQLTGGIISYKIFQWKDFIDGERVLLIDDLADGGATFIYAANALKKVGVTDIGLCVSHGIFSPGLEPLKYSGINRFYMTDSFIRTRAYLADETLTVYKIGE